MDYECVTIEPGEWPELSPDLLAPRIIVGSYWVLPRSYSVNYFNSGVHLILVTSGEISFDSLTGRQRVAGSGEMIAVYPGKEHHYAVRGGSPVSMYQVSFFAALPPNHQGVPFLPGCGLFPELLDVGEQLEAFISLFEQIIHVLMNLPVTWQSCASARLLDMINLVFSQVSQDADSDVAHMNQWDHVIAQLENHQRPLSIQEMAANMNMTPEHFIRRFKKYTGHTPKHYLQERRLWRARQLLIEGRMVKEVALECGFNDQLYFSRLFKKHFGVPPSEFTLDNQRAAIARNPVLPISRNFFAPGMKISQVGE